MLKSDFYYDLPTELIAQKPLAKRTACRLMHLNRCNGQIQHINFSDFASFINKGDLLVFNDTKVIPARLFGRKETGGKAEVLVERILPNRRVLAHLKASKALKTGNRIRIGEKYFCIVSGRDKDLYYLDFEGDVEVSKILEEIGHTPLPPYINRKDDSFDRDRYQTIFADKKGAVAAPTAGLHFDTELIGTLHSKGVFTANITLHVGSGTFTPLHTENIDSHVMYSELYEVSAKVIDMIRRVHSDGGRVIAVGTTVLRALESASIGGELKPIRGETNLFIKPGFQFLCVDALLTNFHLPESTLLILVCAFAGYRQTLKAYNQAVKNQYRFFSYGDAMLISDRLFKKSE